MLTYAKSAAVRLFALLILATLTLAGCQATETYYRGYTAENQSIAPLSSAGAQQGYWKTFDIDLSYQYEYMENALNISGAVNFGFYYEINIGKIRMMDIYLFFLDNESKVLETALLSRSFEAQPENGITFSKNLAVPTGSQAIAFGYKGQALGDGGGESVGDGRGGGMEFFSDLPKRPH